MFELEKSHTSQYIKQVLQRVLDDYAININQIYTVTTDNGRNMIKATELLKNEIPADEQFIEKIIGDLDTEMTSFLDHEHGIVNTIRCASHTLQLVVHDVVSKQNCTENINRCRKYVIALRTPKLKALLRLANLPVPKLDVTTRWNSTYDMLCSFLALKDFCVQHSDNPQLDVPEDLWTFCNNFIAAFEPVKKASILLQESLLIIGDFYKIWLQLKHELTESSNPLSEQILLHLDERGKSILNTDVIASAIYLDPRFNFLLDKTQEIKAISHLKKLFLHLKRLAAQEIEIANVNISNQANVHQINGSVNSSTHGGTFQDFLRTLAVQNNRNEGTHVKQNFISDLKYLFSNYYSYSCS